MSRKLEASVCFADHVERQTGRHIQYEKFYAGPAFVMNAYSYFNAPWQDWTGAVTR